MLEHLRETSERENYFLCYLDDMIETFVNLMDTKDDFKTVLTSVIVFDKLLGQNKYAPRT
jgi:hypothetical protein